MVDFLAAASLGMQALGLGSARRAQRRAERRAKALEAERRAAKKAALKAVKKAYRELGEDSSRALKEALKTGSTSLYKSVGGTTQANFARGMYRQYGIAQRQARREEAKALADIESRSVMDANDFAGLAAGEGALAEMRNDLIKQGLKVFGDLGRSTDPGMPPSSEGRYRGPQGSQPGVGEDVLAGPPPASQQPTGGPGVGGQTQRLSYSLGEASSALTSGVRSIFSNVSDLFANTYQSISGLFGSTLYSGYNNQLYYSDPVAMQSKPVSGTIGSDSSFNSYTG